MGLCLQGSGHLPMCSSQTNQNITHILLFLDDLLMFYQVFGVKLFLKDVICLFAGGPSHEGPGLLLGTAVLLGNTCIWYICL